MGGDEGSTFSTHLETFFFGFQGEESVVSAVACDCRGVTSQLSSQWLVCEVWLGGVAGTATVLDTSAAASFPLPHCLVTAGTMEFSILVLLGRPRGHWRRGAGGGERC